MISEQEEAMEAALLAGMVKSKMKNIDSMMESRPDIPADRINLHEFVRSATQQQNIPHRNDNTAQNHVVYSVPAQQMQPISRVESNVYEDLEKDIKNININLEKINNNLTKLTGMFGKVFQNITKTTQK